MCPYLRVLAKVLYRSCAPKMVNCKAILERFKGSRTVYQVLRDIKEACGFFLQEPYLRYLMFSEIWLGSLKYVQSNLQSSDSCVLRLRIFVHLLRLGDENSFS